MRQQGEMYDVDVYILVAQSRKIGGVGSLQIRFKY